MAIPPDLARGDLERGYEPLLANHGVPAPQWPNSLKWRRDDLDFCLKYGLSPTDRRSCVDYNGQLREKSPSDDPWRQARQAMALYYRGILTGSNPIWMGEQAKGG